MHVRKIYVGGEAGGAATAYWEQLWRRRDEIDARGTSTIQADLLAWFLPTGATVLEAGCGTADIVEWLDHHGWTGVGADLAGEALQRARGRSAETRLALADVTTLPFPDGAFDGLVSLGVVEHFEAGPERVLSEHRRVLHPGGVLFLVVPRVSWYRQWSDLRHLTLARRGVYIQKGRLVTARGELQVEDGPGAFHQYEFPRRWIAELVEDAGFEVTATVPFGVSEGTGDGPLLRRIGRLAGAIPTGSSAPVTGPVSRKPTTGVALGTVGRLKAATRQATVGEAGTGPVGRSVTWLTRHAIAHQILVVARAR